jgi:hypothetical protein
LSSPSTILRLRPILRPPGYTLVPIAPSAVPAALPPAPAPVEPALPSYDVDQACAEIADITFGGGRIVRRPQDRALTLSRCMERSTKVHRYLADHWSSYSASARAACIERVPSVMRDDMRRFGDRLAPRTHACHYLYECLTRQAI